MKLLDSKKGSPSINLTSLIDILFLLIIFFVVTMRFEQQSGIKVKLPAAEKSASESKIEKLVIELTSDDNISLNGKKITWLSIDEELDKTKYDKEKAVILNIDKKVPHGKVIKLMDRLKLHDFEKVLFGTTTRPK